MSARQKSAMEHLISEFNERLDERFEKSEEKLKQRIREFLPELLNDEEFARNMRFGNHESPKKLVGSKYSRYGLTVSDVEFLYDLQTALHGQPKRAGGLYTGPSEELTRTFEAVSKGEYESLAVARDNDIAALENLHRRGFMSREDLDRRIRAMDTAETGYGSELVGNEYVGELWEAARRESRVFSLIDTFEMEASTAYLPVEVDIPEMLFVSENTANNSSEYSTVKTGSNRVQVDAKKFVIHQMWSGEMEEDSIIPFIPFLRRQAQLALAHYSDSLILNGDTTNAVTGNINLDDADPADTKHYLAFDGIRHVGLVDNTANATNHSGAPINIKSLKDLRALMLDRTYLQDWGHPTNMADLVYAVQPELSDEIALLDEVTTLDKYGPRATIFTGEVGQVLGHPVISSIALNLTEADGKSSTTASNNTLGQVVAFNRRAFRAGWRRRVRLETERLPARDQTRLVYSLRLGFGRYSATGAASGIEAAAVLYNIAV